MSLIDEVSRSFFDLKFENQFLKKSGNEFQDFFADIMERCYPGDFMRTRPWGRYGDRKNDGYLRSQRTLFQVYAPNEMKAPEALTKIDEDFYGSLPYWKDYFDTWIFVHNAYDGLGPHIVAKLLELGEEHAPLKVIHWGLTELHLVVRKLNFEDLVFLFGYPPTQNGLRQVGFRDLKLVLDTIAESPPVSDPDLQPPPSDKMERNALSEHTGSLLRAGMRKSERVRRFFSSYHDPVYGDRIVETFRQQYISLRESKLSPDEIFDELWKFAAGDRRKGSRHESSVLAVLAYLFEECDIFEGNGSQSNDFAD
jgi:hypothetical protein